MSKNQRDKWRMRGEAVRERKEPMCEDVSAVQAGYSVDDDDGGVGVGLAGWAGESHKEWVQGRKICDSQVGW